MHVAMLMQTFLHGHSFPTARLKRTTAVIAISPPDQYELSTLLGWAFQPAEEQVLLAFLEQGRQDAQAWAEEHGLLDGAEGVGSAAGGAHQRCAGSILIGTE